MVSSKLESFPSLPSSCHLQLPPIPSQRSCLLSLSQDVSRRSSPGSAFDLQGFPVKRTSFLTFFAPFPSLRVELTFVQCSPFLAVRPTEGASPPRQVYHSLRWKPELLHYRTADLRE